MNKINMRIPECGNKMLGIIFPNKSFTVIISTRDIFETIQKSFTMHSIKVITKGNVTFL